MEQEMKVPLLKGDRVANDTQYRSSLPVNMFAQINPVHGVEGFMASHPGFSELGETTGRDRGGVYNERLQQHLRVSGDNLVEVLPNGTIVVRGDIPGQGTQYAQASFPYSFNSQAIITGGRMWLWNGGTLTEILDVDLGYVIDGTWCDGYYVLTDGENLFHTELTDESQINPIKFATSEFSPDPTIGLARSQDNQVIAFNRYTTEFFYDAGLEGFAFQRINGKATKAGILGPHCKVELEGLYFCLGSGKEEAPTFLIIWAGKAENFSNREVDNILSTYTEGELRRSVLTSYSDGQDKFIYCNLPRHTLLFNYRMFRDSGAEFAWSILQSGILNDEPWLPINQIYDGAIGGWVSGTRTTGIGALSPYSPAAYYIALREIMVDGLWVLDDLAGTFVAVDSSGYGNNLTYFGAHSNEQPTFLDDNRASTYFGAAGSVTKVAATWITERDFAVGFISTYSASLTRRLGLSWSAGNSNGVIVYASTTEIEVEIYQDGGALGDTETFSQALAEGDVVIINMAMDAAGVFSYEVFVNFVSIGTKSGDVSAITLSATAAFEGFYAALNRGQYLWYKAGGITEDQIAILETGHTNNFTDVGPEVTSVLVLQEPTSGAQLGEPLEYVLYSPFINLRGMSVDELELETIAGIALERVTAFLSITYDGQYYSREWTLDYSRQRGDRNLRFIFRRLGYITDWFAIKLRVVAAEKVAFCNMVIRYGE